MCEPARLLALYRAVVEQGLGVGACAAQDDGALLFVLDDISFVLRNTAPANPGLLDVAVYLHFEASACVKEEACRQVAQAVPCLRAWVDADGDIVLNLQSISGRLGMVPPPGVVKDLLPQAIDMLRYAVSQVRDHVVLAGILRATGESDKSSELPGEPNDHAA
ncbi:hypothetical protein ASD62_03355 [Phycicoccus sp. Root563]|uniref:hypothetical protein n=1 Tax=Phycicoccus sp. Root563 TaxID=1736562 RepID=UPI00070374C9|nr:hypothetical protein [Phycicoccus sp. Root563]KQZ88495.1 hypothetical protein ASD62_03355 [Phycicoccus sp. Root563]